MIGFGWSILILLGLSIAVYAIARAPTGCTPEEAQRHIEASQQESAVEEESLGATP